MPLAEARAIAEAALADPGQFRCRRAPAPEGAHWERLAPQLRGFFNEFDTVEAQSADPVLARALIGPSRVIPGYIRIGNDTEHREAAVMPSEEAVYAIAEDVPIDKAVEGRYASIYHYLAFIALLHGE
jgi:hypothetical protein